MLSAGVDEHCHFKRAGSLANELSDAAKADETKGAALDALAVCKHAFIPLALMQELIAFSHSTIDRKDQADCQLRYCVSILAWTVGNVNTAFGSISYIYCIYASACSHD